MKKLNEKQKAFIDNYVVSKNATEAAIAAGYAEKTAHVQGCRLLKNVKIKDEIDKRLEKLSEKTGVTAEFVINELKYIAQQRGNDVGDWVNNEMVFHSSDELSDEVLATIESVEVKKTEMGRQMKIKRHCKMKALDMLARHLQLFDADANQAETVFNITFTQYPDDENSNRTATDG